MVEDQAGKYVAFLCYRIDIVQLLDFLLHRANCQHHQPARGRQSHVYLSVDVIALHVYQPADAAYQAMHAPLEVPENYIDDTECTDHNTQPQDLLDEDMFANP